MSKFTSEEAKDKVLKYYDTLLGRISVKYENINVQSRFGDTYCIAAGEDSAFPLILLHSGNMNSSFWIEDIAVFSKFFKVYAIDIPGEPGKSSDQILSFDTDDYSDWLSDVLDFLDVKKAILIGASLGAFAAIKFSINHAEKVSKLVLLSPLGIVIENKVFPKVESAINDVLGFINEGNPLPDVLLNYQKYIEARINSRKDPIALFDDEDLKKLNMPCALFLGENDDAIDVDEIQNRFKDLVKDSEIVILKDKKHDLTGISDDILKFLKK
ncbi:MAG: alpha/beta hydrolase [Oscillospiraceae bacterium]|nr:alpha/beta hydrolase [Oscillospiraceae bacterium]